jgi:hypothetical protein
MNELAGMLLLLWLPLTLIAVLAAAAGLVASLTDPKPQPLLLRRELHGPRSLATVRYTIDVGDSA